MTRVIAKKQGFHGHLREPGDVFEIDGDEELGDWMLEVDEKGHPVTKKGMTKAEKDELVRTAPAPSAPFAPQDLGYKAKHVARGTFVVVDAEGNTVGQEYPLDPNDKLKAKTSAQAEADRLNAGGALQPAISPQAAAQIPQAQVEAAHKSTATKPEQQESEEDDGPDA